MLTLHIHMCPPVCVCVCVCVHARAHACAYVFVCMCLCLCTVCEVWRGGVGGCEKELLSAQDGGCGGEPGSHWSLTSGASLCPLEPLSAVLSTSCVLLLGSEMGCCFPQGRIQCLGGGSLLMSVPMYVYTVHMNTHAYVHVHTYTCTCVHVCQFGLVSYLCQYNNYVQH